MAAPKAVMFQTLGALMASQQGVTNTQRGRRRTNFVRTTTRREGTSKLNPRGRRGTQLSHPPSFGHADEPDADGIATSA